MALSPIALQVDASSKIERDLPAQVECVAGIKRPVLVLIGGLHYLHRVAVAGVGGAPISEQERSISIAPGRRSDSHRAIARVLRVGRRHPGVKLELACRFVGLVIVVLQNAIFHPDFHRVLADNLHERRVEAVGIVMCADTAAAPGHSVAPVAIVIGFRDAHNGDVRVRELRR